MDEVANTNNSVNILIENVLFRRITIPFEGTDENSKRMIADTISVINEFASKHDVKPIEVIRKIKQCIPRDTKGKPRTKAYMDAEMLLSREEKRIEYLEQIDENIIHYLKTGEVRLTDRAVLREKPEEQDGDER